MTTTLKNNEYIVFQPDQVLTDKHLNQLFNYLDRQNRLTRNKLIGMGIVCGFTLEVKLTDNNLNISCITITKGCGITSQGYLISDCDDKKYGYAVPYTPPGLPHDLPFNCRKGIPFYSTKCTIYQLITYDQYKTIVETPGSTTVIISPSPCSPSEAVSTVSTTDSTGNGSTDPKQPKPLSLMKLSDYAVVLFLEVKEKDLKNCDTQDCNNGGEKMVFNIRPLLVPKNCLKNNCGDDNNAKAPEIRLKRFDVATSNPANNISNTAGIFKTFQNIFNGASPNLLDQVSDAYGFCYTKYNSYLPPNSNTFSGSSALSTNLKTILSSIQDTYLIQYFYDYINDLILAYYEFREITADINCACCADECAFPLHLVLGDANKSTNNFSKDCYRTYFVRSAALCCNGDAVEKLRFYYHRMEIMVDGFKIGNFKVSESVYTGVYLQESAFNSVRSNVSETIKITPSQYEAFPLSQRAIPYYYNPVGNGDSLYTYWNFEKTAKGNEAFNLSYNANLYNKCDKVVNNPLLYDIEKYNFFRIEGHIGQPYVEVVYNLILQKQQYNLPINIVAVAADKFFLTPLDISAIRCYASNLLAEYETRVIEFICKLWLCLNELGQERFVYNEAGVSKDKESATTEKTDGFSPQDFFRNFKFGSSTYNLGDLFRSSGEDTISTGYVKSLSNNQFKNAVDINSFNCDNLEDGKSYYSSFNIFYAADLLFRALLNTKVEHLSASAFESLYKGFDSQFSELRNRLSAMTVESAKGSVFSAALFEGCACDCLPCLFFDLLWLLEQIILKIKQYETEMVFINYFKKHSGLEHKAGVPKGGTFVLVYSGIANKGKDTLGKRLQEMEISTNKETPVIIADFYIPYLCCSDCAPIVYINQPPDTGYLKIQPKFLYDDTNNYPFDTNLSLTPDDFKDTTTNPGGLNLLMDNDKFCLHPDMDIKETLPTFLLYKNSLKVPITIVKPDASFTITPVKNVDGSSIKSLKAIANNQDATSYEWSVKNENGTAINLPDNKQYQIDFSIDSQIGFTISLFITYIINDNTSTDTKTTTRLTLDQLGQPNPDGSFDPPYQPEPA